MPYPQQPTSGYKLCPQCRQIYPGLAEFCVRDEARLVVETRILDGKYVLQSRLGGGPGVDVYAAEQPQLGRMVVIKLLPADPEVLRTFDDGVRLIGSLKHEHAVTLYDSGRAEDGRPYIVSEYLEGEDLAKRLARSGALASGRAVALWRQAVSAVAAAHRRSLVHADLKPGNLFLTPGEAEGGQVPSEIVKVLDFRIARLPPPAEGAPPGAELARYAAPEVLAGGEPTPRADVYSLGLVLLEMVYGRLLEPGLPGAEADRGPAVLRALLPTSPQPGALADHPPSDELLRLMASTLRRDPAQRPADAGELLPLIKTLPEVAPPPPPSSPSLDRRTPGEHPPEGMDLRQSFETPQMGVAVLNELLQKLREREQHTTQEQAVRRSRTLTGITIALLLVAGVGALLWLDHRSLLLSALPAPPAYPDSISRPPSLRVAAPLPPISPPADLVASGSPPDLQVVDAAVADLASPPDLAAAPVATDFADSRAIKVRLIYTDDDEVTSIECVHEAQVITHINDRRGTGIEALIQPGGSCRATGPHASRTYKYDALLAKHPDATGFRRVHVRLGDSSGGGELPPTR